MKPPYIGEYWRSAADRGFKSHIRSTNGNIVFAASQPKGRVKDVVKILEKFKVMLRRIVRIEDPNAPSLFKKK